MFSNLQSLNQAQTALAKRLIERMSSLIIDKECFEILIELVEYKIKQKLTPKQRKLIKKSQESGTKVKKTGRGRGKPRSKSDSESGSDDVESDSVADTISDEELDENQDETVADEEDEGDYALLKHIDDDGEKGLKLLNIVLGVHSNYCFANAANYKTLLSCVNSPKDHIVSMLLKLLANHFSCDVVRASASENTEVVEQRKINEANLNKLKTICKNGKPKQAKHAIYLIHNCFEKPKNEQILVDIYKTLVTEIELKQEKNILTCLVSLGHICMLVPRLVGKEIKDFLLKTVIKEIIMQPNSQSAESSASETNLTAIKKRNNIKLAGKWCEDEDQLPFATRTKVF